MVSRVGTVGIWAMPLGRVRLAHHGRIAGAVVLQGVIDLRHAKHLAGGTLVPAAMASNSAFV
jgi:hypothetical protein